jgi:hypothetical protein
MKPKFKSQGIHQKPFRRHFECTKTKETEEKRFRPYGVIDQKRLSHGVTSISAMRYAL